VIPFDGFTDMVGSTASGYSASSGVITLPSGYQYVVKGSVQARFSADTGYVKYIWQTAASADLGRRGTLIMQEEPQLFGGDEIAICLVDAVSASVDIKLVVQSLSGITNLNNTTDQRVAGWIRAEIWRI
jgi:Tfp pilus assembly major pilin PilA